MSKMEYDISEDNDNFYKRKKGELSPVVGTPKEARQMLDIGREGTPGVRITIRVWMDGKPYRCGQDTIETADDALRYGLTAEGTKGPLMVWETLGKVRYYRGEGTALREINKEEFERELK